MEFNFTKKNKQYTLMFTGNNIEKHNLIKWYNANQDKFNVKQSETNLNQPIRFTANNLNLLHQLLFSIPRRVVAKLYDDNDPKQEKREKQENHRKSIFQI